jgi:hypothetical protein
MINNQDYDILKDYIPENAINEWHYRGKEKKR